MKLKQYWFIVDKYAVHWIRQCFFFQETELKLIYINFFRIPYLFAHTWMKLEYQIQILYLPVKLILNSFAMDHQYLCVYSRLLSCFQTPRKQIFSLMFAVYSWSFSLVLWSFSLSLPLSLGVNWPLRLNSKIQRHCVFCKALLYTIFNSCTSVTEFTHVAR